MMASDKCYVENLCREIDEMASRVGATFVPDQRKIDAFLAARARRALSEQEKGE